MHAKVLQIMGNPSSINQNAASLAISIQVGVKWNDNADSFLALMHFFYLDFFTVVEHASDSNWLQWPFVLKFV